MERIKKTYLRWKYAYFKKARDVFAKASQSKNDAVKKSARAWLQYTDNEQQRVKNLNLRRESIS